jgi:hypothetical protein
MRAKSRVLTRELGQGRGPERRPVVTMGHGREVTAGQEGGGADPRLEVDDYPCSCPPVDVIEQSDEETNVEIEWRFA